MKRIETKLKGVFILEPDVHGDNRGWFLETYNKDTFIELGINNDFVQDNISFSAKKGTLRGLHYQKDPYSQAKLVRCTKGKVVDVAVDLRKGSPTYGEWTSCELSSDNKKMFFIPRGFAHGFLTLTDDVIFEYKCDNLYNKESEGGVIYNDPTINIDWGKLLDGTTPTTSEKDIKLSRIDECNANFIFRDDR